MVWDTGSTLSSIRVSPDQKGSRLRHRLRRGKPGPNPAKKAGMRTALLMIDVINDMDFPGSETLVRLAEPMAKTLRTLKRRARAAGIPTIYINDNFGKWQSDFRATVAYCMKKTVPGHRVAKMLKPDSKDYFVLKPKQSAFFGTTLDTLLRDLKTKRLILTGIAADNCVLFSANDGYLRDFKLHVPS